MEKKKTSRMAWRLAALLVAFAALALWRISRPPLTVEEVDELIRTRLPVGSDKTEVWRLLVAHGWRGTACIVPQHWERDDPKAFEYHALAVIYADTPAWSDGIFSNAWISMIFILDNHGKLLRYRVRKAFEGL